MLKKINSLKKKMFQLIYLVASCDYPRSGCWGAVVAFSSAVFNWQLVYLVASHDFLATVCPVGKIILKDILSISLELKDILKYKYKFSFSKIIQGQTSTL